MPVSFTFQNKEKYVQGLRSKEPGGKPITDYRGHKAPSKGAGSSLVMAVSVSLESICLFFLKES